MSNRGNVFFLAGVVLVLGLFGCVPGPTFLLTKVSCARNPLTFEHQSISGSDGLTDVSGSLTEKTAIRMLAERRVGFIEQKRLDQHSPTPLGLLVEVKQGSFAKIWIDRVGSESCIANNQHMGFGVSYDLYAHGMKPSECLAGSVVSVATGRFLFQSNRKQYIGPAAVDYELRDKSNNSMIASIQSLWMETSAGAGKLPFPRPFVTSCHADPQTVANLFTGNGIDENPLPVVKLINTSRPLSGKIRFVRTKMSRDEFLEINTKSSSQDITLATKGGSPNDRSTIAVSNGHYVGQYQFSDPSNEMLPISTGDAILRPGKEELTLVWRTGESQNLSVEVEEGKFLEVSGYKVAGNRLLFFAVTDWTKGWSVFEASLGDFDITTAGGHTAEFAKGQH